MAGSYCAEHAPPSRGPRVEGRARGGGVLAGEAAGVEADAGVRPVRQPYEQPRVQRVEGAAELFRQGRGDAHVDGNLLVLCDACHRRLRAAQRLADLAWWKP